MWTPNGHRAMRLKKEAPASFAGASLFAQGSDVIPDCGRLRTDGKRSLNWNFENRAGDLGFLVLAEIGHT